MDLAEDGNEAWQKLRAMQYDCRLVDLQMLGVNVAEMYRLLEDLDAEVAKRVILISGDVGNPRTSDLIDISASRVLLKPFHLDALHRQRLEAIDAAD